MLLRPTGGAQLHGSLDEAVQNETYGGYECEFIERPPSVFQTKCPICRLILRDPYEATCCAYSFCYTCSQQVRRNNSPCPWCRKDKFEVKENVSMRRSLNQLRIYCTYNIDGCTWRGELGELQAHINESDHSGESITPV